MMDERNDRAFVKMFNRIVTERENMDRAWRAMERITRKLGFDPERLPEAYGDDEITDDPRKMLKAAIDAFSGASCCLEYALQQIDNRDLFQTLNPSEEG